MKTWTGQVTKTNTTPWNDSITLHSFKIDQSERWFRLGKNEFTFKEGDWIRFNERNTTVDPTSVEVGVQAEASDYATPSMTKENSPPTPTAETVENESPRNVSNVSSRIQYQAARADAARIVAAALHADHLPHPANTAKGKRLDLLMAYVKEVTHEFLKQESEGQ